MLIWSFSSKSFKFHNRTVLSRDPVNNVVPLFENDVAQTSAFLEYFWSKILVEMSDSKKSQKLTFLVKNDPFPE